MYTYIQWIIFETPVLGTVSQLVSIKMSMFTNVGLFTCMMYACCLPACLHACMSHIIYPLVDGLTPELQDVVGHVEMSFDQTAPHSNLSQQFFVSKRCFPLLVMRVDHLPLPVTHICRWREMWKYTECPFS